MCKRICQKQFATTHIFKHRFIHGKNNLFPTLLTASTINPTSVGNTYAGGIFGYVNGNGVYGLDTFKNRLETITLADGTTKKDANYLFVGDYNINAIQNGKSTATTNGKAIAGGLVGKGMFNLNGSDSSETNLALASPT